MIAKNIGQYALVFSQKSVWEELLPIFTYLCLEWTASLWNTAAESLYEFLIALKGSEELKDICDSVDETFLNSSSFFYR